MCEYNHFEAELFVLTHTQQQDRSQQDRSWDHLPFLSLNKSAVAYS